ncbi:hypothetical protein OKW41_006148 [Paraburkholderia sp. UCT70]|uniref:hypothetical protein n=1 Tax=Paraburkholderia sp. UCT70 TaxID=2991068 RepID=UPI003D1F3FED
MNAVVYTTEGIIHSPDRTAIAAKTMIARRRRRKQITALEARRAWTSIECEDDDLDSQLGTLLSHPAVFGRDPFAIVRGSMIDGKTLFRDALQAFVDETRARNGCLQGEPLPVFEPNSLASFLRGRREGLSSLERS